MALAAVNTSQDLFSDESINQVRDQLRSYIVTSDKSQTQIAREIGVSGSVLSQFQKGIYTGTNEKIAYAVQQWLELETRRQTTVKVPGFAMTTIAEEVIAIAKYAHEHQDTGVVYGPAGSGKTVALKQYVEQNPGTVFLTADVTISNSKAILEELLDKLGRQEYGDRRRLRKAAVTILKGSGRLIIIDEAQHLTLKALETIRSIYDECGIGLVLSGNEQVYTNMIGKRNAPFAQLFSRVGIRRGLSGKVNMDDIKKIVCQDMAVEKECLEQFHKIASTPGGMRLMVKLFVLAWTIANGLNEPLSLDAIRTAQDFLFQQPWR
ncbi:MAG: AAA family ATPase [Negativicutes bacterium]|nr:AAA family ATPase [Negativicutes bacterium]